MFRNISKMLRIRLSTGAINLMRHYFNEALYTLIICARRYTGNSVSTGTFVRQPFRYSNYSVDSAVNTPGTGRYSAYITIDTPGSLQYLPYSVIDTTDAPLSTVGFFVYRLLPLLAVSWNSEFSYALQEYALCCGYLTVAALRVSLF